MAPLVKGWPDRKGSTARDNRRPGLDRGEFVPTEKMAARFAGLGQNTVR